MKKMKKLTVAVVALTTYFMGSCDFSETNIDPDNVLTAPIAQQLTSLTVNVGFLAGSDLNRYSSLFIQQFSGQSTGARTQMQQYESFEITGNDVNNAWLNVYAVTLNDAENIIKIGTSTNNPHYSGVAKILKAYTYQVAVDAWGKIPFSQAQGGSSNTKPVYDSDEVIYAGLISLLDQGIAEVNATTSASSPNTNSTIYSGAWPVQRTSWVKLANTLKLRLFLHYSEKNPAFAKTGIDNIVASGVPLFSSNADSFQMPFTNIANGRNPIDQFQTARIGNLVTNAKLVGMMNSKNDPRRASYFTLVGTNFVGAIAGAPASPLSYSNFHTYLRGALVGASYTGAAPIRMLTFAEYNFIRAEAALRFNSPGSATTFYQAGITASMSDAGVIPADITTYIIANGTLTGTPAQQLEQIINEKYIASYGVVSEPWSDWRRTGYPTLVTPSNSNGVAIPRSLFYPQSEIDLNGANVSQKVGLSVRVFWDTRP